MSPLGQKRTCAAQKSNVRFTPNSDRESGHKTDAEGNLFSLLIAFAANDGSSTRRGSSVFLDAVLMLSQFKQLQIDLVQQIDDSSRPIATYTAQNRVVPPSSLSQILKTHRNGETEGSLTTIDPRLGEARTRSREPDSGSCPLLTHSRHGRLHGTCPLL